MNADLFGHIVTPPEFRDIRNQRESVAKEKARLCHELNLLCKTPPRSLNSASINTVRAWRITHKASARVLASKDSSRSELQSAISSYAGV
jgi:hypothetical protein